MKKIFKSLLLAALLVISFTSCTKDDPAPVVTFDKKVLIINQGNYSEQSASLSLYDENTMQITNRVYETANGISIGATIVSGVISPQKEAYLVCNNPDKIEIIDATTGKTKSSFTNGLASPRNLIFAGDKLYVTNWDYEHIVNGEGWWEYNKSYVAIYDAVTKALLGKILVGTDAEGLALFGTRLFVATKEGVVVVDVSNPAYPIIKTITASGVTGGAKHLAFDANYNLWASFPSKGIVKINPSTATSSVVVDVPVDSMDGFITAGDGGQKIYTYKTIFNSNYEAVDASVYAVDVNTNTATKFFSGTYFYGVGVSPSTGNLFTAEVSFTSNSLLKVVGKDGALKSSAGAGIGTSRYLFF